MNRSIPIAALLFFISIGLSAQRSPTAEQRDAFGTGDAATEAEWDALNRARGIVTVPPKGAAPRAAADCPVDHLVFGWNPYWVGTAYESYDFSLLTDISYFSYDVDPATGSYSNIYSWKSTNLVPMAKAAGVRVNLCVTLFSGHATFFGNPTAVQTLIDSLVALVELRDADGVNIDFEAVPVSQKENLTAFMRRLGERFHADIPGSQISIALPAVDWSKTFDVAAMEPYVDLFIIMGYGYHWGSSPDTGPIAPKNNGTLWQAIDLTRSIDYYRDAGVPNEKLLLGLPWYGYEWPTESDQPKAATTGSGRARTFAVLRPRLADQFVQWDDHSSTPWFAEALEDGTFLQTWYDDSTSMAMKYELAVMKDLAGVGIWALGYDGGFPEMWGALHDAFGDCGAAPCAGGITDMGGPRGTYHPDDDWTYTITPDGATRLTVEPGAYDLADDRLVIHDGGDTDAPVLTTLSGEGIGTSVTSSGGSVTFHFTSNGTAQGAGFALDWSCSTVPTGVDDAREESIGLAYSLEEGGKIVLTVPAAGTARLRLHDLRGRQLGALRAEVSSGKTTIPLSAIAPGVATGAYLLVIEIGDERRSALVVVR